MTSKAEPLTENMQKNEFQKYPISDPYQQKKTLKNTPGDC